MSETKKNWPDKHVLEMYQCDCERNRTAFSEPHNFISNLTKYSIDLATWQFISNSIYCVHVGVCVSMWMCVCVCVWCGFHCPIILDGLSSILTPSPHSRSPTECRFVSRARILSGSLYCTLNVPYTWTISVTLIILERVMWLSFKWLG